VNPQDPLANLQPLRDPALISWWPLAPGWWLLLLVGLLIMAALLFALLRYLKRNAYRRRALVQLQALHEQFENANEASLYLRNINSLLKSVALVAYPPDEVAARHGDDWESFLGSCAKPGESFPEGFSTATYRKNCPDVNMAQLQRAAQHWIKHHRVAS
jgi:hypothetical protein